jgi:hypothetical protein
MTQITKHAAAIEGQAFPPTWLGLYQATRAKPQLVDVPQASFLMIDGAGDPNTAPAYAEAIEALYSVSYTLKFKLKKETGLDYHVMALEGLWWAADMEAFFSGRKDDWFWTMMITQPESVTAAMVGQAMQQVRTKRDVPALGSIRLAVFAEGRAAQILHVGPYSAEGPTIARLHAFIREQGYELSGKHHEIYLGDPRRSAPERGRTVVRQPVRPRD